MTLTEKQLAQNRPSGTTAVSIYTPPASTKTIITTVMICNTTALPAAYSLYHDDDGTTYNESTALAFTVTLAANSWVAVEVRICSNSATANIAVQTSIANALTFTFYGMEVA